MAVRHQLIRKPPAAVWSVLRDGSLYAHWVVGTDDSWNRDGRWPAEGSEIGYVVKFGPLEYRGRTVSRVFEPGHRLELESMGGRSGSVRIAITVQPWAEDTLVIVDEHPLSGAAARWHNSVLDAALQLRHRAMLSRLARVVESGEHSGSYAEEGGPRVGA
ncbi:SRPBCC family protein [Streptomyces exfoliatus]|uniref:SRPBCC family protein n=1 Tax=Streptomyces exfoliatus TaxID=1905 RepID=UPI00068AFDDD|nr:SRPBCC family protein [Streptomyces exfoliatus]